MTMAVRGLSTKQRQTSFWTQPRPIRTSHAETRPRTRSRSMTFVDTRVKPGVTSEVENFWIFGDLRKTETAVRNTLPTALTIETERTLHSFENERKATPGDADYGRFYRCLSASVVSSASHPATGTSSQVPPTPTADEEVKASAPVSATSGQYLKVQSIPAYLQN